MNKEQKAENQTRFHSTKHQDEEVLFGIKCPKCKSTKCYCESDFKKGTKFIFCPDCEYSRFLTHTKNEDGKFIWKGKTKNSTIYDLIGEGILIENTYAIYFIKTNDGGGGHGRLKTIYDYYNFIEYLAILSKQNHNMKTATLVTLADDRAQELIF